MCARNVDESLLAGPIQGKDDAGWVARVVCGVVSGRGFNDDPCAATCTGMVDEALKGGADRVLRRLLPATIPIAE
jgi:hypothetical protein